MICSKIGSLCPHPVEFDENLVFVMIPFKGFENTYDQIKLAVQGIEGKNFKCQRADEEYTNLSIWCERICKNIRKSRYLIVDTTGKNPNVFYELGFSHALDNTEVILITQNIKDAPFDILDLNHIIYTPERLSQLREKIVDAIKSLEKKREKRNYKYPPRENTIESLKSQLRQEEDRAERFKNKYLESEKREEKLKEEIRLLTIYSQFHRS